MAKTSRSKPASGELDLEVHEDRVDETHPGFRPSGVTGMAMSAVLGERGDRASWQPAGPVPERAPPAEATAVPTGMPTGRSRSGALDAPRSGMGELGQMLAAERAARARHKDAVDAGESLKDY